MNDTTAPRRDIKLAPSGRLVFTRPPESRKLGRQIDRNEAEACDWKGCGCARFKLGRYCKRHALNYAKTGHPVAASIRRGTWAPYVVVATKFVNEQLRAGHPGIEAAVRWAATELFPKGVVVRKASPLRPHTGYCSALTRARRNGVEPVELLARAVAAELCDDRAEAARPVFSDDMHQRHQSARLFLYELPIVPAGWARRRREHDLPAPPAMRIRWKVREYTHHRVNEALGHLALRSAAEIKRRLALNSAPLDTPRGPVPGSASPFTNETQDTQ